MKTKLFVILTASVLLLSGLPGRAMTQGPTFVSGSTGEDGPFQPTQSMTMDVPPGRVFNYTRVNIPADVTIRYRSAAPIVILATEDVTINGTIDVSGQVGGNPSRSVGGGAGGAAGPGGGAGGSGGFGQGAGARGLGAGGGAAGAAFAFGSGGTYPTNLLTLIPLTGGSGGGGGGGTNIGGGFGGGGGGGALLLASSGAITVNGAILANGSNGFDGAILNETEPNNNQAQANAITLNALLFGSVSVSDGSDVFSFDVSAGETISVEDSSPTEGAVAFELLDRAGNSLRSGARRIQAQLATAGPAFLRVSRNPSGAPYRVSVTRGLAGELGGGGSGGGIRLVANTFAGTGRLQAVGGLTGGSGIIRIEAFQSPFTGNIDPLPAVDRPGIVIPPNIPMLRIASIAGVAVPLSPQGPAASLADVVIPPGIVNPIPVVIEGMNIPPDSQITVRISGRQEDGSSVSREVMATLMGDATMTRATVPLNFTAGLNIVEAFGTFVLLAQQAQQLPRVQGERIERVRVESRLGQGSRTIYITASGAEVPAERLFGHVQ